LWGENYFRKGEAPPPEITREGSNPSPGILLCKNPKREKGVIGERNVPYAFCCGGRISGRGKHPLLR